MTKNKKVWIPVKEGIIDADSIKLSYEDHREIVNLGTDDKPVYQYETNRNKKDLVASCNYMFRGRAYSARAVVVDTITEVVYDKDTGNVITILDKVNCHDDKLETVTDRLILEKLAAVISDEVNSIHEFDKLKVSENKINKFINEYKYKG